VTIEKDKERVFLVTRSHIVSELEDFEKQTVGFSVRDTEQEAIQSLDNLTGCGIVIKGRIVYHNMREEAYVD
jgi:hypothetical protein